MQCAVAVCAFVLLVYRHVSVLLVCSCVRVCVFVFARSRVRVFACSRIRVFACSHVRAFVCSCVQYVWQTKVDTFKILYAMLA
jgi:hypothetical protein